MVFVLNNFIQKKKILNLMEENENCFFVFCFSSRSVPTDFGNVVSMFSSRFRERGFFSFIFYLLFQCLHMDSG